METIKISKGLIEAQPNFMTLLSVDTTQKKTPGVEGELKHIAWITLWNFKYTSRDTVTEFAKIAFQPNTTGYYDTEGEALEAAQGFIEMWTSTSWIFTQIMSEWATE